MSEVSFDHTHMPDVDDLPLDELQRLVHDIQVQNDNVRKECNLYESFLSRTGSIISHQKSYPATPLSLEQKFLVTTSELKDVRDEIELTKESSEKYLEQLRVSDYAASSPSFCEMMLTRIVATRRNRNQNRRNEKGKRSTTHTQLSCFNYRCIF